MKAKVLLSAVVTLGLLAGCSSNKPQSTSNNSETTAPAAKAAEKITGRVAFQKMYIQARGWASDALPFAEESQPTSDASGKDGVATVWRARFGSRIRATAKTFVWSGTDASDAPSRGITPSSEDTFSESNTSTRTFDLAFLKSDSNAAFSVAQEHGGKKLLDKTPTLTINYVLAWDPRENTLIWHVTYGGRRLAVAVNASTGKYIRVEQ